MSAALASIWIRVAIIAAICITQCGCDLFFAVYVSLFELDCARRGGHLDQNFVCVLPTPEPDGTDREIKPSGSGGGGGGGAEGGGASSAREAAGSRAIRINGRTLSGEEVARIQAIERRLGLHLTDGAYWYDAASGLYGPWKGPAMGLLPAGLDLGGPLAADASAGGTGVFANGRELHRFEVAVLREMMPLDPGRYWLDERGNAGREGSPKAEFNLLGLARARSRPPEPAAAVEAPCR